MPKITVDSLKLRRKKDNSHSGCHILPCKILYNGPAEVDKYFHPKSTSNDSYIAYLRGRKLHGHKVELKENYIGVILKETAVTDRDRQQAIMYDDNDDNEESLIDLPRKFEAIQSFNDVTVWYHEALPDMNDPYVAGLGDWINLAHTVSKEL